MSLRTRIFIIVSLGILFVLGISIVLILKNKAKKTPADQNKVSEVNSGSNSQNGSNVATSQPTQVPEGIPIKKASTLEAEQNGVKQLAKVYVERYGTYSTENEYQNIRDLEELSTESLWKKFSAIIRKPPVSSDYTGVTTKGITDDLSDWSEKNAVVSLRTVRTEEKLNGSSQKYVDYTINLVNIKETWLVDSIVWKY